MSEHLNEAALLLRLDELTEKSSASCARPLTEEDILKQVFGQIEAAEVLAVLLHGSRSTGRNHPTSDVDLVVLTNNGRRTILSSQDANGFRYHMYLFEASVSEGPDAKISSRFFYGMRPIYDPEGAGERLAELVNAAERAICAGLPKEDPEGRDYLLRLLDLMERADEDTAFFVRVKLLLEFPAFLSAYNGFRLIGFKNTIDCLLRDDRELAMLYAEALRPGSGRAELEALLRRAFDGLCGLNVLDTDFRHSEKTFEIPVGSETMYSLYGRCTKFMDTLRVLRPRGMEKLDFYRQCRQEAPELFRRLRALAVPPEIL